MTVSRRLCKLRELPRHLQFNEFIFTGYRPPSRFRDCLRSVLQLHNETFNILSHSLALVYFLGRFGDYSHLWHRGDVLVRLIISVDYLTSTLPFALSVVYHTFMPHEHGPELYRRLLKIDVFGVWFTTTFGSLSGTYVTLYCLPTVWTAYLAVYLPLSLVVFYYMVVMDSKMKRVVSLTALFSLCQFFQLIRLTTLTTVPLLAFQYYFVMNVLSGVGALINALHVPERWFPGKCDYLLNGHSLMHIVALLSMVVRRYGSLIDLEWLTSKPTCHFSKYD